jgi:trans-aconitate 2-methyltransferase
MNSPTDTNLPTSEWNAHLYDKKHAFVWQYGANLVEQLAPQPGETILDVGCGTGHLTAQIAESGAHVMGFDASHHMIAQAKALFPHLNFRVADARDFHFVDPFDAIFSNATLHWVQPAEAAVACMAHALKPGGRFVVEFGGKGNVQTLTDAMHHAGNSLGLTLPPYHLYFPSIAEYTTILEGHNLETTGASLFDRPTPLEGEDGLRNWIRMFGAGTFESVPLELHDRFFEIAEEFARPTLYRDNIWFADYRRLRIHARKVA